MKRLDNGRPSLVEFLGSIKFSREQTVTTDHVESGEHFARVRPVTRRKRRVEDAQLIRSAN